MDATGFVLPPPDRPSVEVAGSKQRFAVRRIYCVGRNYAEHVREMGNDPAKSKPFFFAKPADALVASGAAISYPPGTSDLHHEIELVVAIGTGGAFVAADRALDHVWGYAAGIDLTRRDIQAAAKAAGRPWDMAKGFDHSAPVGSIAPAALAGHVRQGRIWLAVDGVIRQDSGLDQMILPVPQIIAALSAEIMLQPGDLIFTGTPHGVGPVLPGQTIRGGVGDLPEILVHITAP